MNATCRQCIAEFQILDEDLEMLRELSPTIGKVTLELPPPTLCADCRAQRRLAHVNQLNLYQRKCDLTGAPVISNIRPGSSHKVYRQEDWHDSGSWDATDYGRDFDFSMPFFEQYAELMKVVPRPNVFTGYEFDENSEYTNHAGKNKDCYMIFDSDENRDCFYSYSLNQCVNCVDCFRTRKSELCYECIDCVSCYGSSYLQDCDNCANSMFLKNCTGCKNCLMCSNLKNKEYYVDNKPVSKEEFEKFRVMLNARSRLQPAQERFTELKLEYPQKYMHGVQNEDVVGDYLVNCKNAYMCFDSEDLWDCRYVYQGFMPLKTCMDIQECGEGERLYECSVAGYGIHSSCFCDHVLAQMNDMLYSTLCNHSKYCFGCVGVQRNEYCILNKKYSKEEYEELVPKIVEHMKKTGEWGEFFPVTIANYAYNETIAIDYYPLTKEQVLERGWVWLDEADRTDQYMGPTVEIPDSIDDVQDDICKQILTCANTKKQYKVIPQELAFYRTMNVPVPQKTFLQRHKERMALRNTRKLYKRQCAKGGEEIMTTFAPDRPETVYCEQHYLESLQ